MSNEIGSCSRCKNNTHPTVSNFDADKVAAEIDDAGEGWFWGTDEQKFHDLTAGLSHQQWDSLDDAYRKRRGHGVLIGAGYEMRKEDLWETENHAPNTPRFLAQKIYNTGEEFIWRWGTEEERFHFLVKDVSDEDLVATDREFVDQKLGSGIIPFAGDEMDTEDLWRVEDEFPATGRFTAQKLHNATDSGRFYKVIKDLPAPVLAESNDEYEILFGEEDEPKYGYGFEASAAKRFSGPEEEQVVKLLDERLPQRPKQSQDLTLIQAWKNGEIKFQIHDQTFQSNLASLEDVKTTFAQFNKNPSKLKFAFEIPEKPSEAKSGNHLNEIYVGVVKDGAPAIQAEYQRDKSGRLQEADLILNPSYLADPNFDLSSNLLPFLGEAAGLTRNQPAFSAMGNNPYFHQYQAPGPQLKPYLGGIDGLNLVKAYGAKDAYSDVGVTHFKAARGSDGLVQNTWTSMYAIDQDQVNLLPRAEGTGQFQIESGRDYLVEYTYENFATTPAKVNAEFYLSQDLNFDASDVLLGKKDFTLQPGQALTSVDKVTIPEISNPETLRYFVGVRLNLSEAKDQNLDDNSCFFPVTFPEPVVEPTAPPQATAPVADPEPVVESTVPPRSAAPTTDPEPPVMGPPAPAEAIPAGFVPTTEPEVIPAPEPNTETQS